MKNWIRLLKDEAEENFWRYVAYPVFGKVHGKQYSMWEIKVSRVGKSNMSWGMFIEKSQWKVLYNPFEDKFRLSAKISMPGDIKITGNDDFLVGENLKDRIESITINKMDISEAIRVV